MDDKYNSLHQIHPSLRKFIKQIEVRECAAAGILLGNIQISKLSSTNKSIDGYANRFTLEIPYAGQSLKWEMIFSNDDLNFAPDFNLFNDDFLSEIDVNETASILPSWKNWDSSNSNALNDLLLDLIKLYKRYQINLLNTEKYSRILYEYKLLIEETEINEDDVEILVDEQSRSVHFLISLSVDLDSLPPPLMIHKDANYNKHQQPSPSAILIITFQQRSDGIQIQQPQLLLASHVEHVLGGCIVNKHIPAFSMHGCLMDYVPSVKKLIDDKIKFICDNFHLKRKYIAQLLAIHTTGVLEYDSVTYSKATLLFNKDNFHCLLFITINNNFPHEKPKWILRSVYHMTHSQLFTEILNDYPYSPRWCPEQMIQRALKYTIEEKIISFQNKSIQNSHV